MKTFKTKLIKSLMLCMLASTAVFQQALADEDYFDTVMKVDNETSQTFYITTWSQNMQSQSIYTIVPPTNGGQPTTIYAGEDDSGTNTVFVNGFNGMTIVYNGDNSISGNSVTQAINLTGISGRYHTYQYGILLPANLNNQYNCDANGFYGGISPICYSSASETQGGSNWEGTGTIVFVIPSGFPQPRSLPS